MAIYPVSYQPNFMWTELAVGLNHLRMTSDIIFSTLREFEEQEAIAEATPYEQNFQRVDIIV